MKLAEKKLAKLRENAQATGNAQYILDLLTDKTNVLCVLKAQYQSRWYKGEQHIIRRYMFFIPIVEKGFIHNVNVTRQIAELTGRRFVFKDNRSGGVSVTNGYYSDIIKEVEDVIQTNIRYECYEA